MQKNLELENEVAEFIRAELKYDDIEIRPRVSGKHSDRDYDIDVLAKINDKRRRDLRQFAFILMLFSALLIIFFLFDILETWIFDISVVTSIICLLYLSFTKKLITKYIWVKCKNLKTKVNRAHVVELIQKYKDYQSNKDKQWNITGLSFFSVSGYDTDAKQFAKEHGIICYEKNELNQFVRTNLSF